MHRTYRSLVICSVTASTFIGLMALAKDQPKQSTPSGPSGRANVVNPNSQPQVPHHTAGPGVGGGQSTPQIHNQFQPQVGQPSGKSLQQFNPNSGIGNPSGLGSPSGLSNPNRLPGGSVQGGSSQNLNGRAIDSFKPPVHNVPQQGIGQGLGSQGIGTGTANSNFPRNFPQGLGTPINGVQKHTVPLHVPKNGNLVQDNSGKSLPGVTNDHLQTLMQSKNHADLQRNLQAIQGSPDLQNHPQLAHMNLDKISGVHQQRLENPANFQHWQQSNMGQQLNLQRQFQLQRQGDLTRQMNLQGNLINAGGWSQRNHGIVAPGYTTSAFSVWYAGGGCYPQHCWYPRWSPWVNWCMWNTCVPFYDPRPYYCRPYMYGACQPWVYYNYPVWQPLPFVSCGSWVNVTPVVVQTGVDLQLLAVRFVDNGHPEQNLGPRYRVWVRNNSSIQITSPFTVLVMASNDTTAVAGLPQAGVVVPTMDVSETKSVDLRLPLEANRMGVTPEGHRVPFNYLQVLVDAHQQIAETSEDNNGAVLARTDILPVDPAAFSTDQTAAAPGAVLTIAGEGFGPEPGQVVVSVAGQQTQAVIQGWYDLGIRFTVPNYTLTGTVEADILVVRGDGAASNPLNVQLSPQSMLGAAQDMPGAPIPDPPQ